MIIETDCRKWGVTYARGAGRPDPIVRLSHKSTSLAAHLHRLLPHRYRGATGSIRLTVFCCVLRAIIWIGFPGFFVVVDLERWPREEGFYRIKIGARDRGLLARLQIGINFNNPFNTQLARKLECPFP